MLGGGGDPDDAEQSAHRSPHDMRFDEAVVSDSLHGAATYRVHHHPNYSHLFQVWGDGGRTWRRTYRVCRGVGRELRRHSDRRSNALTVALPHRTGLPACKGSVEPCDRRPNIHQAGKSSTRAWWNKARVPS